MRAKAAALAMAVLLIGCGQRPAQEAPTPAQRLAESLDVCAGPGAADNPICQNEALKPIVGEVGGALVEAASSVSPEGGQLIAEGQLQWMQAKRTECEAEASQFAQRVAAGDAAAPAEGGDAFLEAFTRCMGAALEARKASAKDVVETEGGFTFQRVETASAAAVTASIAAELGDAAPAAITANIAFPRIDNPNNDATIARFNAAVAQEPRFRLEDQTTEQTDYEIAFASPDLVSVLFEYYDYTAGAANPNTSMRAVTMNMKSGAMITAADVFAPGDAWQDVLVDRAMRSLAEQLVEREAIPRRKRMAEQVKLAEEMIPRADVKDAAVKPHLWLITPEGLRLLFPQGTFGARALGEFEVTVPWAELAAYVNPQAPAPIRQAASAPG